MLTVSTIKTAELDPTHVYILHAQNILNHTVLEQCVTHLGSLVRRLSQNISRLTESPPCGVQSWRQLQWNTQQYSA